MFGGLLDGHVALHAELALQEPVLQSQLTVIAIITIIVLQIIIIIILLLLLIIITNNNNNNNTNNNNNSNNNNDNSASGTSPAGLPTAPESCITCVVPGDVQC